MKLRPIRSRQLAVSTVVSALIAAVVGFALPAAAATGLTLATGDSRTVAQPSVPATCTTLTATLATSNEQFSSSAESSPPDTSRIQSALNSCSGTGEAVVLAPSGSDNAFLSVLAIGLTTRAVAACDRCR